MLKSNSLRPPNWKGVYMGELILFDPTKPRNTDYEVVQSTFHGRNEIARSHAATPIKRIEDIMLVEDYILNRRDYRKEEIRLRDYLMFVMGINFGLRAGDLLRLQYGHILEPNGRVRDMIELIEEKTENTNARLKRRHVYVNDAVFDALKIYMSGRRIDLDDYLFTSQSNNAGLWDESKCLSRRNAERILKQIVETELKLDVHASTHMMRKTFAYQTLMSVPDRNRALEIVQKILNHSTPQMTMHYIGITDDEIQNAYKTLNLGLGRKNGMDFYRSSGAWAV